MIAARSLVVELEERGWFHFPVTGETVQPAPPEPTSAPPVDNEEREGGILRENIGIRTNLWSEKKRKEAFFIVSIVGSDYYRPL